MTALHAALTQSTPELWGAMAFAVGAMIAVALIVEGMTRPSKRYPQSVRETNHG